MKYCLIFNDRVEDKASGEPEYLTVNLYFPHRDTLTPKTILKDNFMEYKPL